MNETKSDEQTTDNGPDAFEDIDLSNGGDIFLDVLGIEFTPVCEKGTLGKCHREEDQEGGIIDWRKAKSFSRSGEENVCQNSGEIKGQRKGGGKKKLKEHKEKFDKLYSGYLKNKKDPTKIQEYVEKTKEKILSGK